MHSAFKLTLVGLGGVLVGAILVHTYALPTNKEEAILLRCEYVDPVCVHGQKLTEPEDIKRSRIRAAQKPDDYAWITMIDADDKIARACTARERFFKIEDGQIAWSSEGQLNHRASAPQVIAAYETANLTSPVELSSLRIFELDRFSRFGAGPEETTLSLTVRAEGLPASSLGNRSSEWRETSSGSCIITKPVL